MKLHIAQLLVNTLMNCESTVCVSHVAFGPSIIAFTGTRTAMDVRDDLLARPVEWPGATGAGCVFEGFSKRTDRFLEDESFRTIIGEMKNPILAGYSLGGTTAVLMASHLAENQMPVSAVYTFGCPPLCDTTFQEYYRKLRLEEKTFRFTTPRDPVVRVPAYKHLGIEVSLECTCNRSWQHHLLTSYADGLLLKENVVF